MILKQNTYEYNEDAEEKKEEGRIKLEDQYDHLTTYPNVIEGEQLSTTFSIANFIDMPH